MFTVHKWLGVIFGGVILLWLLSGIMIILPREAAGPARQEGLALENVREFTVSPAEAVSSLSEALGGAPKVRSIGLQQIGDSLMYRVSVEGSDLNLVNAETGEVVEVTPALAAQLAQAHHTRGIPIRDVSLVTHHHLAYPWGKLPAYQIVFDDDFSTVAYVSKRDGTVDRTNLWSRLRARIEHLHTFHTFIIDRDRLRKGLLLALSIAGIGLILSGYYLTISARRT